MGKKQYDMFGKFFFFFFQDHACSDKSNKNISYCKDSWGRPDQWNIRTKTQVSFSEVSNCCHKQSDSTLVIKWHMVTASPSRGWLCALTVRPGVAGTVPLAEQGRAGHSEDTPIGLETDSNQHLLHM